jgi:ribosomal protein S27E
MSTLTLAPTLFDRPGGEPSLDEVISSAWEVLTARRAATCLVCGSGLLEPQYGAHARPIAGRCSSCGSTLS